jgi:hypothetical protein
MFQFQVYENFANYQFEEYVKSRGKNLSKLSDAEREAMKKDMRGDLYPGIASK